MRWLIDSNVLLRGMEKSDPRYALTRQAVGMLLARGDELCITLQSLAEFWNVCTRPATARGGLSLTVAETDRRIRIVERYFTFLPEPPAVRTHWRSLVVTHQVQGVQVHDARLVAAMATHQITHLLTFNLKDFLRYPLITAAEPQDVIAGKV